MLNLVQNNIPLKDNKNSSFKKKPIVVCSVMQWKNMDREEAVQKDCAERNKLSNPFGNNSKYVWFGIGVAGSKHITDFKFPSLAKIFT